MEDGISWCVDLLRPATRQHFCAVLPSNESLLARNCRFPKGRCDHGRIMGVIIDSQVKSSQVKSSHYRQDSSAAYPLVSLSHSPISYWTPGRSQADFLFGESVALCCSRSAPSHRRVGVGRAGPMAGPRNWARGPCGAVATADAKYKTRPRGDARPAKVSTLSMSSVAESPFGGWISLLSFSGRQGTGGIGIAEQADAERSQNGLSRLTPHCRFEHICRLHICGVLGSHHF